MAESDLKPSSDASRILKAQMGKNLMKIMNFSDDKINNLLATESIEHAKKAKEILKEQREKYKRGKPKKWVFTGLGIFIGLVLGIALPKVYQFFTNSLYDRSQMETHIF